LCIVAIAHRHSARYPLIVAANRDERHARPSAPADWWDGAESLLAGRDLAAGGTWLGVTASGRFAAVTNIFEAGVSPAPRSRGELVTGYLQSIASPEDYSAALASRWGEYGPFNLVLRDKDTLAFASNRLPPTLLAAGIHVFSNNAPGAQWSKVDALARVLERAGEQRDLAGFLIEALSGPAARGPRERAADHPFVMDAVFGTRCTTVVTIDAADNLHFVEQSFAADGRETVRAEFTCGPTAQARD
jgi:uncharacterized protein with NRDE domain